MAWLLRFETDAEAADVVADSLWAHGTTGVAFESVGHRVCVLAGFDQRSDAESTATLLGLDGRVEAVDPTAWSSPPPTRVTVAGTDLLIESGTAFGHGAHPTTVLCLELLERVLGESHRAATPHSTLRVLDVGTGTGVLALAAVALGAERVVGIDIDPAAIDVANANLKTNAAALAAAVDERTTERTVAFSTSPVDEVAGSFDVVVVNMLLAEFEPIGAAIRSRVAGYVIVSGCLTEQAARVPAALDIEDQRGLEVVEQRDLDGWAGLILR